MSLDVAAAVRDGLARLPTRVAGVLVAAYLLLGVASTVAAGTLARAVLASLPTAESAPTALPPGLGAGVGPGAAAGPLTLDVALPIAAALFAAQLVVAQAVGVVAVRTFASDARRRFPRGLARRFTRTVLTALVAGVVVDVLIGLAAVLLILPGVYVAVALYFVQYEVIVAEKGVLDGLRDGWELTRGGRLRVFLLVVVVFVVGLASAVPGLVLGLVGTPPVVVTAVSVAAGAVSGVFSTAIGARAYLQLKPADWSPPAGTEPPAPLASR